MSVDMNIKAFKKIEPTIYNYEEPGVTYNEGWSKLGYTEDQTAEARIKQQTHTAGIRPKLVWTCPAYYDDGSAFTDHEVHAYLTKAGIERRPGTEWFHTTAANIRDAYMPDFIHRKLDAIAGDETIDYSLRREQDEAVKKIGSWFENGGDEFLLNAKSRYGKTLTAYDLILRNGYKKVLIVTNRPSIANSWAGDYNKFVGIKSGLSFVSDSPALKGVPHVISRADYEKSSQAGELGYIMFMSLQDLKGGTEFGGKFDKHEWLAGEDIDLLIADESHEGISTLRTEKAFAEIHRKHTLYMTGTAFNQLASGDFGDENIYNWSYADEQEAKANWNDEDGYNPYECLPRVELRTYQMSKIIGDELAKGTRIDGEQMDYAFDLNEFFATDGNGNFLHEEAVEKFIDTLKTNEKYPFFTDAMREQMAHTLWILNRIDSVKALAKLLKSDSVFGEYKVIAAVGNGRDSIDGDEDGNKVRESNFKKVTDAIKKHDKTITLSVGQLTVGVTIPEWSGVLMLSNMKSPAAYIQAAFRAQNPCKQKRTVTDPETGEKTVQLVRKETAYIFDFDPARTLEIYDEYASNLTPLSASGAGSDEDRKASIRRMLNFFPVIGEDEAGKMITLDAEKVLSVPRVLKGVETMRRGFMCNYLFRDLDRIFGNAGVIGILNRIEPQKQAGKKYSDDEAGLLDDAAGIGTDDDGKAVPDDDIVIGTASGLFGDKYYDETDMLVEDALDDVRRQRDGQKLVDDVNALLSGDGEDGGYALTSRLSDQVSKKADKCCEAVTATIDGAMEKLAATVIGSVEKGHKMTVGERNTVARIVRNEFDKKTSDARDGFKVGIAASATKLATDMANAMLDATDGEGNDPMEAMSAAFAATSDAQSRWNDEKDAHYAKLIDGLGVAITDITWELPDIIAERLEQREAERTRRDAVEALRAHMRGFARTIPSFLMAYGDDGFTLTTMDSYVDDGTFEELTGITKDMFRFLRDGGEWVDGETGEKSTLKRGVIDPFVFDGACREFLKKKAEIGNPVTSDSDEDIFDYVPPQKTNQIYTPKAVVEMQLDLLAKEEPGCFDDPNKTFADLYVKSGYYLTLIAKRLYNSKAIKAAYSDDVERLHHILKNQIFGVAPSKVTSLIAGNYLYGSEGDSDIMDDIRKNLVCADTLSAAENGTMQQLINEKFGHLMKEGVGVKFDYIVGNPPYQVSDGGAGASATPVYQLFSDVSKNLATVHCLVQPARWMTGGKRLDAYRQDMMEDTHIKAIDDFADSKSVFSNVEINGGIVIYVYDNDYSGPVDYTRHSFGNTTTMKRSLKEQDCEIVIRENTLVDIYHAVRDYDKTAKHVSDITSARKPYGLATDAIGHESKYGLPVMSRSKIDDGYSILGIDSNRKRVTVYVDKNYPFPKMDNIDKYKLFVSKAYGAGKAIGESESTLVMCAPVVAVPNQACTETFLEIGSFDTKEEAENFYSYFKTKFFRTLLGIRKQTQDTKRSTYAFVPLQDFTSSSDIDWSLPVPQIDEQLYAKYDLSDDEIDFIESHVKTMA